MVIVMVDGNHGWFGGANGGGGAADGDAYGDVNCDEHDFNALS